MSSTCPRLFLRAIPNCKELPYSLKSSQVPLLLPRKHFNAGIPAIKTWFKRDDAHRPQLQTAFFNSISDELSQHSGNFEVRHNGHFHRFSAPLSKMFTHKQHSPDMTIYLTQTPLSSLPPKIADSLDSPAVQSLVPVDRINSSVWICFSGQPHTPLHRDPYANLFVQLAGRKHIRLLAPEQGLEVWSRVRERIGATVSGQGMMRGEEMMVGEEAELMDEFVWQNSHDNAALAVDAWEAEVDEGDGILIPKGWWHALKGLDDGINGSVSFWF